MCDHVTWLLGSAPIRDRQSCSTIRLLSIDRYISTQHLYTYILNLIVKRSGESFGKQ